MLGLVFLARLHLKPCIHIIYIHTYTHTYIYIYIHTYICVCSRHLACSKVDATATWLCLRRDRRSRCKAPWPGGFKDQMTPMQQARKRYAITWLLLPYQVPQHPPNPSAGVIIITQTIARPEKNYLTTSQTPFQPPLHDTTAQQNAAEVL